MADIAQEAGVIPGEPLLAAASKVLTTLWATARDNTPGTEDGDADALHDMRVAMRRLRTAIQSFEGPRDAPLVAPHVRQEMARHRRRLGKLGDALGAVRDYDVLSEYVQDYAREHPSHGFEHLRNYLDAERDAVFPAMLRRLERSAEPDGLHERFARFALGLPAAVAHDLDLLGAARVILPWRVELVLSCAPHLQEAHNDEGHHAMRKSLRRLRYSIEILAPCLSEAAPPHLDILIDLQDYLGEMQDRSVLRTTIFKAFKAAGKQAEGALPAEVRQFLAYGNERRRELLQKTRDLWQQQQDRQWPQSLSDSINHR